MSWEDVIAGGMFQAEPYTLHVLTVCSHRSRKEWSPGAVYRGKAAEKELAIGHSYKAS